MDALDLVNLTKLLERAQGSPGIKIGLIDGPVAAQHPDLDSERVREIPGSNGATCSQAGSASCLHGTFVAGILAARRGSFAPAICPGCVLIVRPIFSEATLGSECMPRATPDELASAIIECIEAGARVINLSLALAHPSSRGEQTLEQALDRAAKRGVIVVAAAGNEGTVGSSAITRHPWVIPVVAYDLRGWPMAQSNLGGSIGRRGLGAPGDRITSLGAEGESLTFGGTSAAAPFLTGTIALLWSEFPAATATAIKIAVIQTAAPRRSSVVPPLFNAWTAHQAIAKVRS